MHTSTCGVVATWMPAIRARIASDGPRNPESSSAGRRWPASSSSSISCWPTGTAISATSCTSSTAAATWTSATWTTRRSSPSSRGGAGPGRLAPRAARLPRAGGRDAGRPRHADGVAARRRAVRAGPGRLAVIAAPVFLAVHGLLTMNAFEPLFWMGARLRARPHRSRPVTRGGGSCWARSSGSASRTSTRPRFSASRWRSALVLSPERRWLAHALALAGRRPRAGAVPAQPRVAGPARLPDPRGPGQRPAHRQERGPRGRWSSSPSRYC